AFLDAGAEDADLIGVAGDRFAGVEARSDEADLAVGAHDAVAGADAVARDALLTLGAVDVDARRVDAVALAVADLAGGTPELARAGRHARALVADLSGGADVAVVDEAVAVVVEGVALLLRWLAEREAREHAALALERSVGADAELAGLAR